MNGDVDTLMKSETFLLLESDEFYNYLLQRKALDVNTRLIDKEKDYYKLLQDSIWFDDSLWNDRFIIIQFLIPEEFWVFQEQKMIYQGKGSLNRPNGKQVFYGYDVKVEGEIQSGRLNGAVITTDTRDGIFYQEYKDGVLNGIEKRIDKNGLMRYFCKHKNGKLHGLEFGLYDNGVLRFMNYYENGVRIDCPQCTFNGEGDLIKY